MRRVDRCSRYNRPGFVFFLNRLVSRRCRNVSYMYTLAPAPHRTGNSYHTYRGNNIIDYGLKSCIFIEVGCLRSTGRTVGSDSVAGSLSHTICSHRSVCASTQWPAIPGQRSSCLSCRLWMYRRPFPPNPGTAYVLERMTPG